MHINSLIGQIWTKQSKGHNTTYYKGVSPPSQLSVTALYTEQQQVIQHSPSPPGKFTNLLRKHQSGVYSV